MEAEAGWRIIPADAPCRDVCDSRCAVPSQLSHMTQIVVGALLFELLQAESTSLILWRIHPKGLDAPRRLRLRAGRRLHSGCSGGTLLAGLKAIMEIPVQ